MGMMEMQSWSTDFFPFLAMMMVECCEMGMITLGKAAMNDGLSNLVYVVYYNAVGTLFLLPFLIFHRRRSNMAPITLSILWRFFLLGLLGICLLQAMAFTGIKYSSPTLAAALGNLIPGFTFLLAIIFRMEKLDIRKASSQAKSVGTIVAIIGASIMTLYKGPRVLGSDLPSDSNSSYHSLLSQESNWVLGGLLITITCIMSSGWNILQTDTVKKYPEQMTIVFFTCFFGSIQCAILTLAIERNPEAWMVKPGIGMTAIVFSAISGSVFRYNIVTWCLDKKGPLYVAMFKPLGMVIAAILGIIFLSDSLHLGSVIGAVIISAGFYSVLWGKAKEIKSMLEVEDIVCGIESTSPRSPLLLKK
ncbi:WAT1-related protein At3g28050-like isoform X1 [Lycium barbarum]|uniref:WAT1-related protein At3g28050-like isoform X1 n=1 Tax=Lycium barbarum TaxID=112863 RepID=UPI00293EF24D|nr:WAT1-related protein At3g28050-like isoform X1 [Lycium barbarum]XP_060193667.1 WAT1-related protein At3g28050-like isoform X1 [Lycium barbarum]XP_060193668.1 WAT1-related protein At3g28050-like isoform X1 [Lycium barbarum]XP_060193669.1 WAT1-related protein At3g28050-like isoform X1 [Lycium barbarum]XP_060193670.1 WAT1-related protein At3g28050-like isoform X1 [Lycium barbarum]